MYIVGLRLTCTIQRCCEQRERERERASLEASYLVCFYRLEHVDARHVGKHHVEHQDVFHVPCASRMWSGDSLSLSLCGFFHSTPRNLRTVGHLLLHPTPAPERVLLFLTCLTLETFLRFVEDSYRSHLEIEYGPLSCKNRARDPTWRATNCVCSPEASVLGLGPF